jgi:hypothetical protein
VLCIKSVSTFTLDLRQAGLSNKGAHFEIEIKLLSQNTNNNDKDSLMSDGNEEDDDHQ